MGKQPFPEHESQRSNSIDVVLVLVAAILISLYALLRYGPEWAVGGDTLSFTFMIRSMLETGQLIPEISYPNGYGFQALVVYLINISGASLVGLQLIGAMLLTVWIVIPGWLLFREFTGSPKAATLAILILFVQPEFLFGILRGTHEKFTLGLTLICFYLLVRSSISKSKISRFLAFVLAFYLATYALITYNNQFALSFIMALGLAILLNWVANHLYPQTQPAANGTLRRLAMVVTSMLVIGFTFTFYAYPPAQHQIAVIGRVWDQFAALFLPVESAAATTATNPYTLVSGGWVNLPVYLALTLANWLLLGISSIIWIHNTYHWLVLRQRPSQRELLLWSFYTAFGIMGVVTILLDISGALASNLQLRIFPSFAMLAAPLVANWVINWQPRQQRLKRPVNVMLGLGFGILALLALFKATNEPLLSNKWRFHHPSEVQALTWADVALAERPLWTGIDNRVAAGVRTRLGSKHWNIEFISGLPTPGTRDFLFSEITRLRSQRLSQPQPVEADSYVTYDNGHTQIYHLRPRTPYQR